MEYSVNWLTHAILSGFCLGTKSVVILSQQNIKMNIQVL